MFVYLTQILSVGIGGALGASIRYLLQVGLGNDFFPIATFIANMVGSFLLGLLSGLTARYEMKSNIKLCLGTGFCGGFTTMSAFAADIYILNTQQYSSVMFVYISLTLLLGLILSFIGIVIGRGVKR
ncbi:CrcB family protein [Cytobacillus sp. IB215316]|uniref:FluC/FEX family fluoride channel n=1 Tax=Cytobacillus sp. IB215316 TaxID=3097354 RepID=UPI002A0C71FE|nr:CrcB family protein [Cytobacillus sp. IB215316]MDX8359897.1 CrcB family protein [Cytobacillus sp. IB215316]